MHDSKQLMHLYNFQKKKEISLKKEDQIQRRFHQNKGTSISLSWLRINPEDMKLLLNNSDTKKKCQQATQLFLDFNQLQPKGVFEIVQIQWKNLRLLNIASNRIAAKGIQYLSRGDWRQMESLGLMANQISDEGVLHLMKGQWPMLTILILSSNNISERGLMRLVLGNWKKLIWIDLTLNGIGDRGINMLTVADWNDLFSLHFSISRKKQKSKQIYERTIRDRFTQIEELQMPFF